MPLNVLPTSASSAGGDPELCTPLFPGICYFESDRDVTEHCSALLREEIIEADVL